MALAVERHQFHQAGNGGTAIKSQAIKLLPFHRDRFVAPGGDDRPPLTNEPAWHVYAGFLADIRVTVFPESSSIDNLFQANVAVPQLAPKLWADGYLPRMLPPATRLWLTFDK